MSEPDYSDYTTAQLREARRSIDSDQYQERAAQLDLLIRDREKRAKGAASAVIDTKSVDAQHHAAPTTPRPPIAKRAIVGAVVLIVGLYGLGGAGLMFLRNAALTVLMAVVLATAKRVLEVGVGIGRVECTRSRRSRVRW